ncbi:MAG: geranylgeranylglyceryl/heptaprenylglyceryl phosphate synthase [Bacteroides sp.]|nr:geranylgeranylglyceryl/heptaprenylglyceryl phosphate synthase [Bacteroides sp.]
MHILENIEEKTRQKKKQLAILVDPDKSTRSSLEEISGLACKSGVDYIFIGGSLLTRDNLTFCIEEVKKQCELPLVLFPGSVFQIDEKADALLLLSLISGRNPDMLIGNHVVAASMIRQSGLEIIPTGYMLVESGKITSVQYMSNTMPIPFDKTDIAVSTAMAGTMLGLRVIFMDAGSGALHPVPMDMVMTVRGSIAVPLIVGGGIRTAETAYETWEAGADIITIGNAAETHPEIILEVSQAKQELNAINREKNIKFV